MNLFLSNSKELKKYKADIDRIGYSVNDAELYTTIISSCRAGNTFLFETKNKTGFVVLSTTSRLGVLIWVACSYKSMDWLLSMKEVEVLAREIAANEIEIWSIRKGLFRKLPSLGFTPEASTWNGIPITIWTKPL